MIRRPSDLRPTALAVSAVCALCLMLLFASLPASIHAASPKSFSLDTSAAAPRAVEETTAASVQREYDHAWKSLVSALESNQAELLDENFTGTARQHWQQAIELQKQNGLNRRIIDHGHSLRVSFYSLDGSALQAEDVADLEIEYREGGKVLSSEHVRAHYLLLLTPAENSWKVRVLEELPSS